MWRNLHAHYFYHHYKSTIMEFFIGAGLSNGPTGQVYAIDIFPAFANRFEQQLFFKNAGNIPHCRIREEYITVYRLPFEFIPGLQAYLLTDHQAIRNAKFVAAYNTLKAQV
jgi:hypothetical protein